MWKFVINRAAGAAVVILIALLVTFIVGRSVGDPVRQMLPPTASEEEFEQQRENLGLDRPVFEQFRTFAADAAIGDFGESLWQKRSVMTIIMERLPNTFLLAAASLTLAFTIAIPLGVLSAVKRDTWVDRLAMVLSMGGISMPHFWLGIMLILIFSVWLGVLPTSSTGSAKHLILPAITVAALPVGRLTQMIRSAMLDVLVQQYTTVARSKGLTERVVVMRHAFRNAALSVVTVAGWEVARLLSGGVVIVEVVFAWPGIGLLIIQAIRQQDFPLVEAAIMVQAVIIVLVNFFVDLSYVAIDPRLRARTAR